jgi:hypothetical protein
MQKDKRFLGFSNEFMCEPRSECGVYAIFMQSDYNIRPRLLYIGSSKNIRKRVYQRNHWYIYLYRRCYQGIVLQYIYCENYIEVEKKLIKKLNPLLNKIHNGKR